MLFIKNWDEYGSNFARLSHILCSGISLKFLACEAFAVGLGYPLYTNSLFLCYDEV